MSRRLGLVMLAIGLASCGDALGDGTYGTFRFIGRVKGTAPLAVLPPISDRTGNIYTLYGSILLPETAAFVSKVAGSSGQTCTLTKGDNFGAHGWSGFAEDRAWYWSGFALVSVTAVGGCDRVLDVDPQTNADLLFRAVMPWVRVASARRSLVALVQNPTDLAPFSALVDLERGILTNVVEIPGGKLEILGVGAEPGADRRVTLARRGTRMEALFFDQDANFTGSAAVAGAAPPEYGVVGTLRMNEQGTVVGLTSLGGLLVFDRSGGGLVAIDPAITPVGVHLWEDAFYVVGTNGGRPVVLPLDAAGRPGAPFAWDTSEVAARNLGGTLVVRDDRTFPARETSWTDVKSAIGASPFLSAASPWPHSPGTTLWVVAGPVIDTGGGRPFTSIAIAPVGIAYP